MNYYPFHIGDFRGATLHLSNAEELAYRRALDWYYDNEKPIPLETQWVARRLRVDTKDLETILSDFFVRTESGWVNARCDAVLAEYAKQAEKNRANGRKGGRPKREEKPTNNPLGSESDTKENPDKTQSEATGKATKNQKPITSNQDKEKAAKNSPRFDPIALDLPLSIDPEAWKSWVEYRRLRKLTCAEPTMRAQVKKLDAWHEQGFKPDAIIAEAISGGWAGLYLPKGSTHNTPPQKVDNKALAERLAAKYGIDQQEVFEHE